MTPSPAPDAAGAGAQKKRGRPAGSKNQKGTESKKKKAEKAPAPDPAVLQEAQNRMWKDEWICQLIEQRALMQAQFDAPKQGVDLWFKVAAEILANCPDFNKNAEACRKRFAKELKDYQGDKAQNAKSGHDRGDRSKFYDLMDFHFASKATVHCVAHADSETVVDTRSEAEEQPSSGGSSGIDRKPRRSDRGSVAADLANAFANTAEAFMEGYVKVEDRKSQQIDCLTDVLKDLVKALQS